MNNKLHILQHSLGLDEYGRGNQYRNHFVTGEGSCDWPICNELVDLGLMSVQRKHHLSGGDDCFFVTEAGKKYIFTNSPKPPKLSKSKLRYKRYLEYGDCFESFRDFLYWDAEPERSWNQ
jgi:hypothetical protein